MKSRKIYCLGSTSYINWMEATDIVDTIKDADLICFTGGSDVDPITAKESQRHPTLYCDLERDKAEIEIFKECLRLNKKVISICRGSQLSSIFAGGRLVRDQDNPFGEHEIITYDEQKISSASTHHNAMWPWNIDKDKWKLLGWTQGISNYHEDQYGKECVNGVVRDSKECEIVLFRNINTLAHQHHFEFCNWERDKRYKKTLDYLRNQLNDFMQDKL